MIVTHYSRSTQFIISILHLCNRIYGCMFIDKTVVRRGLLVFDILQSWVVVKHVLYICFKSLCKQYAYSILSDSSNGPNALTCGDSRDAITTRTLNTEECSLTIIMCEMFNI